MALRQIGYSLEQAIADLIDNSINAKAKNVLIRFLWKDDSIRSVIIADDGNGMSARQIDDAMRFGSKRVEDVASLGKYGMGMKLASFSHACMLTVVSKQAGRVSGRRWTLKGIEKGWACEILSQSPVKSFLDKSWGRLNLSSSGTLIILDDIDKLPTNAKGLKHTLRSIQSRLQLHLGLHFHRFLSSGFIRIVIDQQQIGGESQPFFVEVKPLDPFAYEVSGSRKYPRIFSADIRGVGRLKLEAHIWPPNSDAAEYKLGNRASARQGFYFYRNNRLIQAGGWNGIVQSDAEPHSSLARVAIDLPPEFDADFGLNVQKSSVVVPLDFERAVSESKDSDGIGFESYRATAQQIYRKTDERAIRDAACIPGKGVPRRIREIFAGDVSSGHSTDIAIAWGRLPLDKIFEIDPSNSRIVINKCHRAILSENAFNSSGDPLILKALLFLLLRDDIKTERVSGNRIRRWDLINQVLISCIEK